MMTSSSHRHVRDTASSSSKLPQLIISIFSFLKYPSFFVYITNRLLFPQPPPPQPRNSARQSLLMASSTTAEVEPSVPAAVAQEVAKIRDSAARLGELLEAELAGNSTVGAVLGELLQSSSRAFSIVNWTLPGGDVGLPSPREASSKKRRPAPAGDGRGGGRKRYSSFRKNKRTKVFF